MPSPVSLSSPDQKVQAGSSSINAVALRGLREAWNSKRLVLFLGAGVSVDYGISTWKNLVVEMLFEQTRNSVQMRDMWPHYGRAFCGWLSDYFQYDPVILARAIKEDGRERLRQRAQRIKKAGRGGGHRDEKAEEAAFLLGLREKLYAGCKRPAKRTTLDALVDLVQRSASARNLAGIVNFNFDDLLEHALHAQGVPHLPVASAAAVRTDSLTILHPHGYLPQEGSLENANVVFTEDEYHGLVESSFHWALTEMVHHLRHCTVLFVGLSMSDPNLRRLLDVARVSKEFPRHFQVQRRHHISRENQDQVCADVERQARRLGIQMRAPEQKSPEQLIAALNATLKQADTYDRKLMEAMKVKTVWLQSFDDLPAVLDLIA